MAKGLKLRAFIGMFCSHAVLFYRALGFKKIRTLLIIIITANFLFGVNIFYGRHVLAPVTILSKIYAAENGGLEERQQLEAQLSEIEKQIAIYENRIGDYQKQGKTLQGEIKRLDNEIARLNLQVKAITITLDKLDGETIENENQISVIETKVSNKKDILTAAIRNLHEKDGESIFEIFLKHDDLNDFYGEFNGLISLQAGLINLIEGFIKTKDNLLEKKEDLMLKKLDAINIKKYRDEQKILLNKTKKEQADLLSTAKNQEAFYKNLAKERQTLAAKIRSRIFELLGGGEVSFEEAVRLALLAQKTTGVRAALILAVLDRESALGQNVGKCNYKNAMHPTRDIPYFLEIVKSLDINPDAVMVSCPNKDGKYGGAMGPAQFIPSTWKIYQANIAVLTGHNPPSPWASADAFIGTALYLKDLGAHKNATISEEKKAAARYYAGSRWQRYLNSYGGWVIQKAEKLEQDIKLINES